MLVILLKQTGFGAEMPKQIDLSEELKLSIMNCIEMIFRRTTEDVIKEFYQIANLNLIAQVLSICELVAAKETHRPLR